MMSSEAAHSMASPRAILYRLLLSASPGTLGDVADDGLSRSHQLVRSVGMASRQVIHDLVGQREEFDGPLVDIKALKTEHGPPIGQGFMSLRAIVNLHDAVAVNVHDHDDEETRGA